MCIRDKSTTCGCSRTRRAAGRRGKRFAPASSRGPICRRPSRSGPGRRRSGSPRNRGAPPHPGGLRAAGAARGALGHPATVASPPHPAGLRAAGATRGAWVTPQPWRLLPHRPRTTRRYQASRRPARFPSRSCGWRSSLEQGPHPVRPTPAPATSRASSSRFVSTALLVANANRAGPRRIRGVTRADPGHDGSTGTADVRRYQTVIEIEPYRPI